MMSLDSSHGPTMENPPEKERAAPPQPLLLSPARSPPPPTYNRPLVLLEEWKEQRKGEQRARAARAGAGVADEWALPYLTEIANRR